MRQKGTVIGLLGMLVALFTYLHFAALMEVEPQPPKVSPRTLTGRWLKRCSSTISLLLADQIDPYNANHSQVNTKGRSNANVPCMYKKLWEASKFHRSVQNPTY